MPLTDAPQGGSAGHLGDHDALHDFYNEYEGASPIFASATAPETPSIDQLWYDTVNDVTKRWNGSDWVFASRELAYIKKSDANYDATTIFSLDQSAGEVVPGLVIDVNAEQQMAAVVKGSLNLNGTSSTGLSYSVAWLEHVLPDGTVVKGVTTWNVLTIHHGTGWTGINVSTLVEDRFVMPVGSNRFRVMIARNNDRTVPRIVSNNYPSGSTAWLRVERMG